jgi:hypothetical protein
MMRTRLRAFAARRRRGAIGLIAVAAMIPVTAMIAANTNSGQMINERRMVQDGADALAAMHATWTARSLNVLSMNNVTTTQLLTVAIGSEALAGTLAEIGLAVGTVHAAVAAHVAQFCNTGEPISTAACTVANGLATVPADIIGGFAIAMHFRYRPDHGMDVANRSLRAIEGMNRAIVERLPRATSEIGEDYARELGIDAFHFADPCGGSLSRNCTTTATDDGMSLPVEEGNDPVTWQQYCQAMDNGARLGFTTYHARGFGMNGGPMTTGGARRPHVRDHVQSLTGIDSLLKTFKDIYRNMYLLSVAPPGLRPFPQWGNLQGTQTGRDNSFLRRFNFKRNSLCFTGGTRNGIPSPLPGLLPVIEAPVPTFWKPRDIDPWDLIYQPDEMPEAFHILALTQKDKGRRLAAAVLADDVESHFGYGQTGVYNPDGANLFSQNWRYRMMPATRMDDPARMAGDLRRQAKAPFAPLAQALGAVSSPGWERVNAH